jgi:N-acetylmuramoyl-L-alanine amidase
MRQINFIVIHCSASDNPKHDNIETIKQWHKENGWSDIGYHYVIVKSGKTYVGRAESIIGSHVKGHNKNSIGICLTGLNNFSEQQKNHLGILLKNLCVKYNLKKTDILGHCDLDKHKTCPNFDLHGFLATLNWH